MTGNGQRLDGGMAHYRVISLARWWTSASQEERFALLRATIHGDPSSPPLETLRLAIIAAEIEAGEVGEG